MVRRRISTRIRIWCMIIRGRSGTRKKTELIYKGYDKSTDSLRYGVKPQKHDQRGLLHQM